ncbi:pyridoxamine 5'-phosphate oxidase family protein [Oricola sp.]|uniref:pyridoxamine 5'-phosphate oxidase family protein n=1 Tax=Oricola sp. TaxID=1979950 RepID=UPI0025E82F33|nr:pyridoxamine 5'-phosphate oxidase family protein [Oricola sp.]MCI5077756.1 pyridoxamine 5'-phosphate oxidase family protein [Oricola sp.]
MENGTALRTEYLVRDEEELRTLFPPTRLIAVAKCRDRLDKHAREFLARSPFLCIGTQSPDGGADVSPRGDPRGFVKVLDDRTLLIPDRPGNNRLDTQTNILANPAVGLLFIIPGFDDTMRVNGKASITRDPELLAMLTVKDRTPTIAIVVAVEEVFVHCAKAFRRSRLWDPDERQDRSEMASLSRIVLDQTSGAPDDPEVMKQIDDDLEVEYQKTMY